MATEFTTTESNLAAGSATPTLGHLPFTGLRADEGVAVWSPPEVSGDWAEQCIVGREFGNAAVDYIRASGDHALLSAVVRAIADRGTFTGVEAGFFSRVSISLAQSA